MSATASPGTVQLCSAGGLSYKVYARTFNAGGGAVLYIIASGFHGQSGYQLFFRADYGLRWTLFESVPQIAPQTLTWYVASTTTSQRVASVPASVEIEDAFGTHSVMVEPWNALSETAGAANASVPGTVQLSTGSAIEYKVLTRPYDMGGGPVLFLFATCYYPTGGWEIFFAGQGNLTWDLLERVPGIVNMLVTYYQATTTTSFGLGGRPTTVTIRDAAGSHQVNVEPWFLDTTAEKDTPAPGPRITM